MSSVSANAVSRSELPEAGFEQAEEPPSAEILKSLEQRKLLESKRRSVPGATQNSLGRQGQALASSFLLQTQDSLSRTGKGPSELMWHLDPLVLLHGAFLRHRGGVSNSIHRIQRPH